MRTDLVRKILEAYDRANELAVVLGHVAGTQPREIGDVVDGAVPLVRLTGDLVTGLDDLARRLIRLQWEGTSERGEATDGATGLHLSVEPTGAFDGYSWDVGSDDWPEFPWSGCEERVPFGPRYPCDRCGAWHDPEPPHGYALTAAAARLAAEAALLTPEGLAELRLCAEEAYERVRARPR
jgi:hypothetical protein